MTKLGYSLSLSNRLANADEQLSIKLLKALLTTKARIQGAEARAHPWGRVSPFKMHYVHFEFKFTLSKCTPGAERHHSIAFKHPPVHHWAPTPGRTPVSAPATPNKQHLKYGRMEQKTLHMVLCGTVYIQMVWCGTVCH